MTDFVGSHNLGNDSLDNMIGKNSQKVRGICVIKAHTLLPSLHHKRIKCLKTHVHMHIY